MRRDKTRTSSFNPCPIQATGISAWKCWGREIRWDNFHDGGEQEMGTGSEGPKIKFFPG